MKAIWNGVTIADSDDVVTFDGNAYFPRASLAKDLFEASTHTTVCGWKGTANYLSIVAGGKRNDNAAWFYEEPKEAASEIAGRVAFWKGVSVS
ncbi:MAG: hypothetical protein ACI9KE_003527 [Polyangiales bacterium]